MTQLVIIRHGAVRTPLTGEELRRLLEPEIPDLSVTVVPLPPGNNKAVANWLTRLSLAYIGD